LKSKKFEKEKRKQGKIEKDKRKRKKENIKKNETTHGPAQ
jgi:hypothetical protein